MADESLPARPEQSISNALHLSIAAVAGVAAMAKLLEQATGTSGVAKGVQDVMLRQLDQFADLPGAPSPTVAATIQRLFGLD